ncbi:MAG: serine hydrolase [Anaerolineae bacterium]
MRGRFAAALLSLLLLAACTRPSPGDRAGSRPVTTFKEASSFADGALPAPTPASTAAPRPAAPATPPPPSPAPTVTPFYTGVRSPACGQRLPLASTHADPPVTAVNPDPDALAALETILPESARPALRRILSAPGTVGLAAYRVGQAAEGAYLNADAPMPLASVVKLIHLVAYAEAVASGQLDPDERISLDELERFYLPGLDLGAHHRAVAELADTDRISGEPPGVRLEEVAWMMIRHSSNAAADYLHMRLGQASIEETAVALGLQSQTAPCPFLGQFLAMANHTRSGSDISAVRAYLEDPAGYGLEAMLLTDAYSRDPAFRQAEIAWHSGRYRPSIATQQLFSESLNPQASARDYAAVMARLAQNGLSSRESSFIARRILEWPMRFRANQALFTNLGYKNGALPGILTTVYYAYRPGDAAPGVVALFFRDLPMPTYHRWRRDSLPHDELARWLLAEPEAIPTLRRALAP